MIKGLTINGHKKLHNENYQFGFPVLYSNSEYFEGLRDLYASFGHTLSSLNAVNFDVKKFEELIMNDPMLNCSVEVVTFNVNSTKKRVGLNDILLEQVMNENNEQVMESIYSQEELFKVEITDKNNEVQGIREVFTKVDLGNLQMYFVPSYLMIDDKINNIQKAIYLD